MITLYKEEFYSRPVVEAQNALMGRTHYVDPATLQFHKARILDCGIAKNGLLFWLIESCASDWQGNTRVIRPVVFDVLGTTVYRPDLQGSFARSAQAHIALNQFLLSFNAKAHTLAALREHQAQHAECVDSLVTMIQDSA